MDLGARLATEGHDDIDVTDGSGVHRPTDWRKPRRITDPPNQDHDPPAAPPRCVTAPGSRTHSGVTAPRLRSALPCEYIFPPNPAAHMAWPMHKEPTPQSKRVGMLALNMRFLVVEIRGNWAKLRLKSTLEGWSPMSSKGKFYLCPFHPELHRHLKPARALPPHKARGTAAVGGPAAVSANKKAPTAEKKTSVLGMLFGTYTDKPPVRAPPPARGRRARPPPRTAGTAGADGPPRPAAAAVAIGHAKRRPGPGKKTGGKRQIVYNWQRQRGRSDDYAQVLESRREELRGCDLSDNPMALQEWVELIKELDVVLRFKFRSKIQPNTDVRKPRSSSFVGSPKRAPAATADTPEDNFRRRRSNSFVVNKTPNTSAALDLDAAAPAMGSTSMGTRPDAGATTAPTSITQPTAAETQHACTHGAATGKCTVRTCSNRDSASAVAAWAAAKSASPDDTPAVAMTTPAGVTSKSSSSPGAAVAGPTVGATRCKHGGDPAVCTYGTCAEARTASQPLVAAPRCKHGSNPASCPYGGCSGRAPALQQQPTSSGTSKRSSSTKMCKHGNPPETCKYGTCPMMEKMVQEEIARLKAASGAEPTDTHATAVESESEPATEATADLSKAPTPTAPATPAAAVAVLTTPVKTPAAAAAGPASASVGGPSGASTPTWAVPQTPAGLSLTGGKRVVVKKVKKRPTSSSKPVRKLVKRSGGDVTPTAGAPLSSAPRSSSADADAKPAGKATSSPSDTPKSKRALFTDTEAAAVASPSMAPLDSDSSAWL
eukprot:m.56016 g.56016  ORF g.56016 m.56016 type:complete len:772 (+) comp7646_c0_seq1:161-2476(+)